LPAGLSISMNQLDVPGATTAAGHASTAGGAAIAALATGASTTMAMVSAAVPATTSAPGRWMLAVMPACEGVSNVGRSRTVTPCRAASLLITNSPMRRVVSGPTASVAASRSFAAATSSGAMPSPASTTSNSSPPSLPRSADSTTLRSGGE